MVEIWTFRVELQPGGEQLPDLTGFAVRGRDSDVGSVSDVSYERGSSFVVVDTGGLMANEVLVPAGTIERIDEEHRVVHLGLTKEEIENAPPLALEDRRPEHQLELERYYRERTRAA